MQSEKFSELINNPYNLDHEDTRFIEELCKKYPFCQTVQILLAKCYQKNNHSLFEVQVNIASAYSNDRQQFQNYISEKEKINKQTISHDKNVENKEGQNNNNISDTYTENNEQTIKEEDSKNEQISQKTIHKTSDDKETTKNISEEEYKKQLEQIVLKRINSVKNKNQNTTKSSPAKESSKKESPVIPTSSLSIKATKNKKSKQDEIIEKFIRDEPRISSPKNIPPSTKNDLSKKSVEFNDNIISETLAEIYLKQGKINYCLNIYNKLSLKFPEKSSYFAKKIEQIKNK